ncbi:MAG TPA: putative O-glycosylation ligase, exosortase A system-associated [Rhodanobacteraceae bacterium]|nr:putative O-glycosylation ligase, exosortase A system-associated [Rhodanobacteraceae bacterium]
MRDIALALFVIGLVPFIVMRPWIGLLVWSWFGYMNPHRLTYGFAYGFPWVQVIAILTLVSLMVSKESKRIQWSSVGTLLLVFLLWTGFTTIFAVMPDAAWNKWSQFAKVLIMVFATMIVINNRQRMHWLVWVIVISLGFYGVKGGLFTILHGGIDHVLGPPNSFIAGNNDLAQALCMTLPLIRYLQLQASRRIIRIGLGVALVLTGVGILGSYSRGGFIALAVVAVALILKSRRRFVMLAVLLAVGYVGYNFMPPQWTARMQTIEHARTVNTAQTRIQSWKFATNVALARPLRGGGFDVYQSKVMWDLHGPEGAAQRAVHSIYFRVLGEQGFIGLGLFLALMFVGWRSCSKVRKRSRGSPENKWAFDLASMLQVSLLAFMVAGLATTSSYFDLSYQLLAMCALLLGFVRNVVPEPAGSGHDGSKPVLVRDGEPAMSASRHG